MSFLFGFDDPKYSDRKLRLIISPDTGSEDNQEDGEEMRKQYKRRRLNFGHCEASTIASVDEVEEYHLNTLLLAKESLFFRRLFDGECFKESAEKAIDIHLTPAEKEPFLDLLKYMYTGNLQANNVENLVGVWHLAQRYIVESCVDLCMQKLKNLPLSLETSCYFLELATVVNQTDEFKDLIKRSISFLVNYFQVSVVMSGENPGRWTHFEDLKQLSAVVLDFLLSSDDLQVVHEESVVHAVTCWISMNCKTAKQERDAWARFGPLIRWPMMETFRIKALLGMAYSEGVHDLLMEALLYAVSTDEEKGLMASNSKSDRFRRRLCHAVPVKSLSIDSPVNYGIFFFSLSMREWNSLQHSAGTVCTERFILDSCIFVWLLKVQNYDVLQKCRVGIFLVALNALPSTIRVDISLSIWDARAGTYIQQYKGVHSMRKGRDRVAMCLDCFGRDLDKIMSDSEFMHNSMTWLRTEVQLDRVDQLT